MLANFSCIARGGDNLLRMVGSAPRFTCDEVAGKESFENDLYRSKMLQRGKAFFEKKMVKSSLGAYPLMTLPRRFVQQHGHRIQKYVTLRNTANGKMWAVMINITFYQNRPQVFLKRGWKDFTVSNDLVIGDRLTFVLEAKSLFHVSIHRTGVKPVLPVQKPKPRSQPDPSPAHIEAELPPLPQLDRRISADGCQKKTENPLNGNLLTKDNTTEETCIANLASDPSDSSQCPSNLDSLYFEPETRGDFLRTTNTRLGTRVQLPGIDTEVPEYSTVLSMDEVRHLQNWLEQIGE